MKQLILVGVLFLNLGCATRHPKLTGAIVVVSTVVTVGLLNQPNPHHCPRINGYVGDPGPGGYCPDEWPELKRSKR